MKPFLPMDLIVSPKEPFYCLLISQKWSYYTISESRFFLSEGQWKICIRGYIFNQNLPGSHGKRDHIQNGQKHMWELIETSYAA